MPTMPRHGGVPLEDQRTKLHTDEAKKKSSRVRRHFLRDTLVTTQGVVANVFVLSTNYAMFVSSLVPACTTFWPGAV